MKTAYLLIASLFAASTTLAGCGVDRAAVSDVDVQGYYFTGFVYDGVTGAPITDYSLNLTYEAAVVPGLGGAEGGTTTLEAAVGSDGRYRVGPLKPGSDFSVVIEADGYRAFSSHNAMRNGLPGGDYQQRTELFEAYLFPTDLESPAITLQLFSENSALPRPSGSVRLTPFNGDATSDLSLAGTLGASVGAQLWFNDNDARNATVIKTVEDGVLEIEASDLVYGVTYEATVFGVEGHSYTSFTFTAGLTGSQSVILDELGDDGLYVVSTSLDGSEPNEDGTLTIVFNRPIRIAPSLSRAFVAELLDDNFSIDSPDADGDADVNVLATAGADEPDEQENGTSFSIDGNTLVLRWANEAASFDTRDTDDPILSVTYAGFYGFEIQAEGEEWTDSVGNLLGTDSLQVQLEPLAP